MSLLVTGAPSVSEKVVTTQEAKDHLRVSHSSDDTYIDALVKVAVAESEDYTQRRLITQTLKYTMNGFPECGFIKLPWGPISAVSSVKYYDPDGTLTTMSSSDYQVDLKGDESEPSYVALGPDTYTWPTVQSRRLNSVEVIFVVGWANSAAVPQRIKEAILLQVTEMYSVRHPVDQKFGILSTTERLLYPHRIMEFL